MKSDFGIIRLWDGHNAQDKEPIWIKTTLERFDMKINGQCSPFVNSML